MCRWRSRLLSPEYPQSSKAERTGPAAAPAGGCSHVRTSLPPAGRQACRETAAPLDNWTRTASAPPDLDRLSSPFVRRDRATARGIFGTSQRTRREGEVGFTFPFPLFSPLPFPRCNRQILLPSPARPRSTCGGGSLYLLFL
jgi:hypothetical protein